VYARLYSTPTVAVTLRNDYLLFEVPEIENNSAKEKLMCHCNSPFDQVDLRIGFDPKYVLQAIQNIKQKEINFHVIEPSKPFYITPVDTDMLNVLCLIMPVTLP
jgi:DNA polymerase III sliding clamp (beta) subunit (PCNA family)